jgi:hypothetical protein
VYYNVNTPDLRSKHADTEHPVKGRARAVHVGEGNAFTLKLAKPLSKITRVKGVKAFSTELCVCMSKAMRIESRSAFIVLDRSIDLALGNAFTAFTLIERTYVCRGFSVKAFCRSASSGLHSLHAEVRHGL